MTGHHGKLSGHEYVHICLCMCVRVSVHVFVCILFCTSLHNTLLAIIVILCVCA